jgi:hypothetical protein
MAARIDIVVFGTGSFAGRIVCDLAATAGQDVGIAVAGRNLERLNWLTLAANARATIFRRPARFLARAVDLDRDGAAEALLEELQPSVVVQAASSQPSSVISTQGDAWSRLVAEGGLSATAVFQARLSARVARAVASTIPSCRFINCCFPDVVNPILAAGGMRVDCGVGNVAILANAFAGFLGLREPGRVKVLAPYQAITPWRRASATRSGRSARVWIDAEEVAEVYATFAGVKLTAEPAIEISGASGVPLMLAMARGEEWRGHVPGPNGLPGGYPVVFQDGVLALDLPVSIGADDAVRWNARFEEENGLTVGADGRIRYTGLLYELLRAASPALAEGFAVGELDAAHEAMTTLRRSLMAQPSRPATPHKS